MVLSLYTVNINSNGVLVGQKSGTEEGASSLQLCVTEEPRLPVCRVFQRIVIRIALDNIVSTMTVDLSMLQQ
jgi:hypothetical protein